MHETALVRDIVRRIEQIAHGAGADRIIGAKVWLGALSHLSEAHFREHFAIEARETSAQGAVLDLEVSNDPRHPHAQHIRLESVELDDSLPSPVGNPRAEAELARVRRSDAG